MNSVPTSVILIVIAIILLYLAVTDKLSRLLDAWDVITGKQSVSASGGSTPGSPFAFNLGNGTINVQGLPPINIGGGNGPGGINIPSGF